MVIGCIFFSVLALVIMFSMSSGSSSLPSSDSGGVLPATTQGRGGLLTTTAQRHDYDWLTRKGVVGQGILLQVSPNRSKAPSSNGTNIETREVVIDIEVPGDAPYQVRTSPFIPVHLSGDVLPGATVELRVDPDDPAQFIIFGPGVGLPLAPFAQAPAVGTRSAPAPAPMTSGNDGRGTCTSCGALVVLRSGGFCPVCGASWD